MYSLNWLRSGVSERCTCVAKLTWAMERIKTPGYTDSLPRGKTSSIFSLGDFSRYPDQASGREPEEAQCRDRREAMGLGRKKPSRSAPIPRRGSQKAADSARD